MIAAKRLLVDTNVWLDYYLQEGAFDEAKRLIELAEAGKIDLLYAPTTAKDLFYIVPRRLAQRNVNGVNVRSGCMGLYRAYDAGGNGFSAFVGGMRDGAYAWQAYAGP